MNIHVVTLFPEWFLAAAGLGLTGKALASGELRCWNPRDYARDPYRTIDGRTYGGGPGMVLMLDPLIELMSELKASVSSTARVTAMSPQGEVLTQARVKKMAQRDTLILLCGRYEGFDERFVREYVDEEISLGDFVLSGGELAALALIDAVIRLRPGTLKRAESHEQDSFSDGLLDCAHYTRPEVHPLGRVPETLLSGNHQAIARHRRREALGRTWLRRPELLAQVSLNAADTRLLDEFRADWLAQNLSKSS